MYSYFNPNPIKNKRVGDCVIRAISKALNQSWEETYIELVGTDHPFLKINIALSHPDFEDEELSFSITTPINYPIY